MSLGSKAAGLAVALCLSACTPREQHLGGAPDAALDAAPDSTVEAAPRVDAATESVEAGPPCQIGGTSVDVPTTLGCTPAPPGRLVIAGDQVYWTVQGPGAILWRAPLVGGAAEPLVYDTAGAFGLVVDATYIYYAQVSAGRIMRLPLAGGAPVTLAKVNEPLFLVSDGASLYWTDSEVDGKIMKLDLSDGAVPITLIDGQPKPRAIAVRDGFVYWTNFGGGAVGADGAVAVDGAVLRTLDHLTGPADGGVRTASRLAGGIETPTDLLLLGGYAYVPDGTGHIRRVPLEGGDLETVADFSGTPYGLATDGALLYWSVGGNGGGIFATPPDAGGAGPITRIVGGQADPHFVAVTTDNIYWTTWGTSPAVNRIAK